MKIFLMLKTYNFLINNKISKNNVNSIKNIWRCNENVFSLNKNKTMQKENIVKIIITKYILYQIKIKMSNIKLTRCNIPHESRTNP